MKPIMLGLAFMLMLMGPFPATGTFANPIGNECVTFTRGTPGTWTNHCHDVVHVRWADSDVAPCRGDTLPCIATIPRGGSITRTLSAQGHIVFLSCIGQWPTIVPSASPDVLFSCEILDAKQERGYKEAVRTTQTVLRELAQDRQNPGTPLWGGIATNGSAIGPYGISWNNHTEEEVSQRALAECNARDERGKCYVSVLFSTDAVEERRPAQEDWQNSLHVTRKRCGLILLHELHGYYREGPTMTHGSRVTNTPNRASEDYVTQCRAQGRINCHTVIGCNDH